MKEKLDTILNFLSSCVLKLRSNSTINITAYPINKTIRKPTQRLPQELMKSDFI